MTAMLALGAILGVFLIGDIFDLWGGDSSEEQEPGQELTGNEDSEDLLQGAEGNDTITGDALQADSLHGNGGNDLLNLSDSNIGSGGEGSDTFRVTSDTLIEDFTEGEDHLEIISPLHPDEADAERFFWDETHSGWELYRANPTTQSAELVTVLASTTAPPPVDDISLIHIDDDGSEIRTEGADITFNSDLILRDHTGTDESERVTLSGNYGDWTVSMGDGDDTVTFDDARGLINLGAGNDSYVSQSHDGFIADAPELAAETVMGGAGDDSFVIGEEHEAVLFGESGNDSFDLTAYSDIGLTTADGGAGDDMFDLAANAEVTGAAGSDTFTVKNPYGSIRITDFNPLEDVLILETPTDYSGAAELTLRDNGNGTTSVLLDGNSYVTLNGIIGDLSAISVVTASPPATA